MKPSNGYGFLFLLTSIMMTYAAPKGAPRRINDLQISRKIPGVKGLHPLGCLPLRGSEGVTLQILKKY